MSLLSFWSIMGLILRRSICCELFIPGLRPELKAARFLTATEVAA